MTFYKTLALFFLFLAPFGDACCDYFSFLKGPHRFYIGPEVYHSERKREGGSKQNGWLYGGHATYERRKHGGLYYAVDGYYATGWLNGKTASGKKLKSELTDKEIQGRLGYALCIKKLKKLTMIPYGGYGYFHSDNEFKKPSPIECEFRNRIEYAAAGMDVSFFPFPSLEVGVDFTAKFMMNGKCNIKNDPDFNNVTLIMENQFQYEVDLPMRYYTCWKNKNVVAVFTPFYRFRHYGGRMNWPFDFIDTKFNIYGARLMLNIFF